MTTENDDLIDRIKNEGEVQRSYTTAQSGFEDPSGVFPKTEYHYGNSTNRIARGLKPAELRFNVSNDGAEINPEVSVSSYPHARVLETAAGHVTIIDDTPGNERILVKHVSGAGIDIKPDGSIYISSVGKTIHACGSDQTIVVEGNATAIYNGDLNQKVSGDWNLSVEGDMNLTVLGNQINDIGGSSSSKVHGSFNLSTVGGLSVTAAEAMTFLGLGSTSILSKGSLSLQSSGGVDLNAESKMSITSGGTMTQSSPSINIAASSLSVFGSTGTIGGEGIIGYVKNLYAGEAVRAKTLTVTAAYAATFHGDLNGTAMAATKANSANTAGALGSGPGSIPSVTNNSTAADDSATAVPTGSAVSSYLSSSSGAVRKIHIDPDDGIKNSLNRAKDNFNASPKELNAPQTRAKMRNPANRSSGLIENQIERGLVSPAALNRAPEDIETVAPRRASPQRPRVPVGNTNLSPQRFIVQNNNKQFTPVAQYNPLTKRSLTRSDYIYDGIQLNRFYAGSTIREVDPQIAKYLHVHAHYIKAFQSNYTTFSSNRLVVAEGVYEYGKEEIRDAGLSDLMASGRAIAYKVINRSGQLDLDKTFELAKYWKDNIQYEKIILDYDRYNVDDSLESRVVLILPELNDSYVGTYAKQIETTYNNIKQGGSELIKVLR